MVRHFIGRVVGFLIPRPSDVVLAMASLVKMKDVGGCVRQNVAVAGRSRMFQARRARH